jgi:tRNA G46 methylase TrmB
MHIELTAYPMPPGTPRLMPFQDMPFNGDGYAAAEVLRLRDKHGLTTAIETGTCYGSSTLWLSEHFDNVYTVEIHGPSLEIAKARFRKAKAQNINAYHMQSVDAFRDGLPGGLYFLDAHWGDVCPLIA